MVAGPSGRAATNALHVPKVDGPRPCDPCRPETAGEIGVDLPVIHPRVPAKP
jgi:hypothetical protein